MYLTESCGNSDGFFPINTKWGSSSTLSGIMPGGGLRFFRPNQAMARGFIPAAGMSGLGDAFTADPTTLALGAGALVLAAFLFGRKHPRNPRGSRLSRAYRELRS